MTCYCEVCHERRVVLCVIIGMALFLCLFLTGCAGTCRRDLETQVWMDCVVRYGPSKFCPWVAADLHCHENLETVKKETEWMP